MKLKICGLTKMKEIEYVNHAQVDYAGFVFTPHRQQITVENAISLKKELCPHIKSVGVFVGEPYDYIKEIVDQGIIDVVQFHGDGEHKMPCPTIRAFRMRSKSDIKPTRCDFVLFDSFHTGTRGATGGMFDWRLIDSYNQKPFFMAGGINISNIKKAMELNPYCIDISSGVEENGEKSFEKIMQVARECKAHSRN